MDQPSVSLRGKENYGGRNPSINVLLLVVAVVVALWLATPFVVSWLYEPATEAGPFGDLFGSINALFSGLAFAGLFYAILLQRRELELQRLELQATREEMKLARTEAERSASAQESAALLSANATLVEHYRSQIDHINSRLRVPDATDITGFRSREPTEAEKSELAALEGKIEKCVLYLEDVYNDLREAEADRQTLMRPPVVKGTGLR